ncbi:hypothetical protein Cabys_2217 [Caldithrix abyssi DSM 13497]|uniref:Uncharacterized protein n=1 Tax=Caldithrix abyssi DSM 13497 TaxID=880073 RepID=A0A1J1C8U6_CALAY|nr:hypothetical protein Cabys_2217 [Caldithrix abyssi DSM 13497]
MVKAERDEWIMESARQKTKMGGIHYQKMVRVSDGMLKVK